MKILIIGGGGMLGHKLVHTWREKFDIWTTIRGEIRDYNKFQIFDSQKTIENINVENISSVEQAIEKIKPNVIVNAVGIIKQLPTAKNIIKTLSINSVFPHQLAELAEKSQSRLIIISTDCVFSGKKGNYTESDNPDADDLYGKSKHLGEVVADNCLTLRTSIIGRELRTAHSLVEWFLSNKGGAVKGFANAVFSGFPTVVLAGILADLIENQPSLNGLYHVSSEPINKFDLLALIKKQYGADIKIERFEDFVIDRSLDSTLFRKATGFKNTGWEEMIREMAADNFTYRD